MNDEMLTEQERALSDALTGYLVDVALGGGKFAGYQLSARGAINLVCAMRGIAAAKVREGKCRDESQILRAALKEALDMVAGTGADLTYSASERLRELRSLATT